MVFRCNSKIIDVAMQRKKITKELDDTPPQNAPDASPVEQPKEVNGRGGLEPTRYGDWEKNGRCIDF